MKIAYVLTWNIFKFDGVTQKIKRQINYWRQTGNTVKSFCFVRNQHKSVNNYLEANIYSEYLPFSRLYDPGQKFLDEITAFAPDVIYLRAELYGKHIYKIKNLAPVVMEINSNDMEEFKMMASASMKNRIRYVYYLITRDCYFESMAGLVGVTNEMLTQQEVAKFSLPSVVIPNSIELDASIQVKHNGNGRKPNLVFIGSGQNPWHGLDKVIRLAERLKDSVDIHVVGVEREDMKELQNLKFYGFLNPEVYGKLIAKCDIGIGTLALHRKNMDEACPLKVREYIAYGLPVIIGYNDTAFTGRALPEWVLQIPNTENNVDNNIEAIYDFCEKMKEVTVSMKEAESYVGHHYLENKRLKFLERIAG